MFRYYATNDQLQLFHWLRRIFTREMKGRVLVSNITVQVYKREVLAMVGPSGAGKSSFLRLSNVAFGPLQRHEVMSPEQISALLSRIGLAGYEDRDISILSGGEAQRHAG